MFSLWGADSLHQLHSHYTNEISFSSKHNPFDHADLVVLGEDDVYGHRLLRQRIKHNPQSSQMTHYLLQQDLYHALHVLFTWFALLICFLNPASDIIADFTNNTT